MYIRLRPTTQRRQWVIATVSDNCRGKGSLLSVLALFNGNRTFGFFFYSALLRYRARRMHSHVWRCIRTIIGTCKCAVALLRRRHRGHPGQPLFYEHFKEHIRTLTLASTRTEGVIIDVPRAPRPGRRRCSFDIDMHYAAMIHSPRSSLGYFLLQNRNHGPVRRAGVIDVYMQ